MAKRSGSATLYANIDAQTLKEIDDEAKNYRLTRSSFLEVIWKDWKEFKAEKLQHLWARTP